MSPLRISSSPIGERQLSGGAISLVSAMDLCSASACARSSVCGRMVGFSLARGTQISSAVATETRLKSVCRKVRSSRDLLSVRSSISAPSSTPWGWGLISTASLGGRSLARGNTSGSFFWSGFAGFR